MYYLAQLRGKDKKHSLIKIILCYSTSDFLPSKISLKGDGRIEKIGTLNQVAVIEEPFPEEKEIDVEGLPVRIAADESAHSVEDVIKRAQMGYKAVALKPIAKTLSMTLKMIKVASERNIPCFCADLTVNPILVNWNKNIAARLAPFPGVKGGLLESNGPQNYKN